ncbi:MAG: histidine kinase dimerization/phosphoacceptor domain -containing protein [Phenylobacterium sp.]|uniref:sensor histidine kinase n=1 Tax=Phenylobacterium sp. TaxID=1871053 RepID=UPI0027367DC7|nr:ATP-binding protein [Phenylobacterium sp.]MDP1643665.1 histidine kinase dimerization/phosphoacceptor domain -containing protein [Phenylobacterium sp.]MDP3117580.1 histidine kinase dimerization/phosphoacceptor domain -containing protein [Phenylobacterium sp.]
MHPISRLIREPVVVFAGDGRVIDMNRPARARFGESAETWREVFADLDGLQNLLERASGSADPVLGALRLAGAVPAEPDAKVEALALRQDGEISYAVKLRDIVGDQFPALTAQVRELNAEIHVRRRVQAELEESLAHNKVLYRELQHRVKNHLQMILALVSTAGRESEDPGRKQFVKMLQSKLSALFDAQRLMYSEESAHGLRVDQMLSALAETVQSLAGVRIAIQVRAEPVIAPNDLAFPLALIANELLTNAVKYAAGEGAEVSLDFVCSGDQAVMTVRDNGPGFAPTAAGPTSSGLGLVRGLCRQIGGHLVIQSDGGAVAVVSFPLPEASHAPS